MKIDRERLLHQLEVVSPGLSPKDFVEQSSCFVFQDGRVMTFNDQVAFTCESCLDVEGAVKAEQLINVLRQLSEDELSATVKGEQLHLQGHRKKMGIAMESEIKLPFAEHVKIPTKWNEIGPEFSEAIALAVQCTDRSAKSRLLQCVHITPKHIEASDDYQMVKCEIKTGVKRPVLVRGEDVKHMCDLGMTEIAVGRNWLHFRNQAGLTMSMRTDADEYPNTEAYFEEFDSPRTVTLPKTLVKAAKTAEIFTAVNVDAKQAAIQLRQGKLTLAAESVAGYYKEVFKVDYKAEPISFSIPPHLLGEIAKNHSEVQIGDTMLRVDTAAYTYLASFLEDKEE